MQGSYPNPSPVSNYKLLLNGSQDFPHKFGGEGSQCECPQHGCCVRRTRGGTPPSAEFIPAVNTELA